MTQTDSSPQSPLSRAANTSSSAKSDPTATAPQSQKNPLLAIITTAAGISLVLVGISTANVIQTYRGFRQTVEEDFRLTELSGSIIHIDEVLSMSARMAASTGDPESRWENRYNNFVPLLDNAIAETIELAPEFANSSEQVNDANSALIDMEVQAFELLQQGEQQQAFDLLFSPFYEEQKQIYADGIGETLANIRTSNEATLSEYRSSLLSAAILAGSSVVLLLGSWGVVLNMIRNYIRERNQSQSSLEKSRGDLLKLNEQLAEQVAQRESQEQATRLESETLQEDVGEILGVVSAVEDGDLTVEAPVSDRVTGLVSDTLNRLIEELSRVLSTTVSTAQQVTRRSEVLEHLALSTAEQTQQQTQSVYDVQSSMEEVTDLSQDTAQQAIAADLATQQARDAVKRGQQEMKSMGNSISDLQKGTEQAIQRSQTLEAFVNLAAQFSKDQTRVASLTRVLAMNASMLASRASGQQDPEQFASVASEFETIAKQVNDLAVRTNQGLVTLQQRTDQIETVLSGLDRDIQDIDLQVDNFSKGVKRSLQAFDNIQLATDRVSSVGEQVSRSSQAIADAASETLDAIRNIAVFTENTANRADATKTESEQIDRLAKALLQAVKFFQLRPEDTENILNAHTLDALSNEVSDSDSAQGSAQESTAALV